MFKEVRAKRKHPSTVKRIVTVRKFDYLADGQYECMQAFFHVVLTENDIVVFAIRVLVPKGTSVYGLFALVKTET